MGTKVVIGVTVPDDKHMVYIRNPQILEAGDDTLAVAYVTREEGRLLLENLRSLYGH